MLKNGVSFIFEVLWALIVTHALCFKELFHFLIFDRRQKSVKDKIVIVTGAGHGLGRRIACLFAKHGATVVCWDMDQERNDNTAWDIKQSNGSAVAVTCDVTDRHSVFTTMANIRETVGDPDILVNCAGIYPVKNITAWTPDELYTLFDTNVMAQFWLLQAVLPIMIEKKSGHYAVISSAAAVAPVVNEVVYSVTKSATTGLMEGLIEELKLQNREFIKVTCIHPYYTACREDIPVKYDLRFGRMSPDYVAGEIVKGILQERQMISVPRFMYFWIYFMKLLPQEARARWRGIFYTRVYPQDNGNQWNEDGTPKNIIEQFRLPPLKQEGQKMESPRRPDINRNMSESTVVEVETV